jgi:hypothetical protein
MATKDDPDVEAACVKIFHDFGRTIIIICVSYYDYHLSLFIMSGENPHFKKFCAGILGRAKRKDDVCLTVLNHEENNVF